VVALPDEHGGWGLTAEPVLLGLLVAPSWAGVALGAAAVVAFLVRTPLKMVLVDRWRHRWLPRTRTAAWVAAGELALVVVLAAAAVALGGWDWLVPLVFAAPLVGVELWYDMRSRGRRLVPELCGAVGITAVVAAIVVIDGSGARLAVALWLVLAARAVAAIPFVRAQINRLRHGTISPRASDLAQAVGVAIAFVAVTISVSAAAGAVAVTALAAAHVVWARRPPVAARVLGFRQLFLGLAVVVVTATGVLLS
jgi:hypothetical protein